MYKILFFSTSKEIKLTAEIYLILIYSKDESIKKWQGIYERKNDRECKKCY